MLLAVQAAYGTLLGLAVFAAVLAFGVVAVLSLLAAEGRIGLPQRMLYRLLPVAFVLLAVLVVAALLSVVPSYLSQNFGGAS